MPHQVLLVEDSRAMRQFVRAILEASGRYEVLEVGNGFEALRTLPREQFDVIITDINMPDVSGIELIRFVRGNERHKQTPVVVISTDASTVDSERASKAGASAFVAKPFTGQDLLAAVDDAVASAGTGGPSAGTGADEGRGDP